MDEDENLYLTLQFAFGFENIQREIQFKNNKNSRRFCTIVMATKPTLIFYDIGSTLEGSSMLSWLLVYIL